MGTSPAPVLACALILLLAPAAGGQVLPIDEFDGGLPVAIGADSLQVDSGTRGITLTGNVEVEQGRLTVLADTMVVHYADAADGGDQRVETIEATGRVTVIMPDGTARADRGLWTVATGIVLLEHNVEIVNAYGVLTSEAATLDIGTGHILISGGESRVNVLLEGDSQAE